MMKIFFFSRMELPDVELLVQLHLDKFPKKKDQSRDQQYLKKFDTFLRLPRFDKSSVHRWLQLGHDCFFSQYRRMMDCSMDENGVTPIPVPTKTA